MAGDERQTGKRVERALTATPQYTEQIVFLDTEDHKTRLVNLASALGVSQARVGREIVEYALPNLERLYAEELQAWRASKGGAKRKGAPA